MTYTRTLLVILFALAAAPAFSLAAEGKKNAAIPIADLTRTTPVDFEKEILPAFSTSCLACHNKTKAKSGIVLETPADIRKGGDDGPIVVPGKSAMSTLLKAATHAAGFENPMPPPANKVAAPDLTPAQLALVKLWIDQGATGEVRGLQAPLTWQVIPSTLDPIYAVAVSPDGRFAACGRANRIDVYDLPAGKLAIALSDPQLTSAGPGAAHRDMVESLAFSPDGTTLASGSFREVKLWKHSSTSKKTPLGDKPATCVAASADGSLIATGDDAGLIRLFDAAGKQTADLKGHAGPIASLRFSADGKMLLSGSRDKSVRVWEIASKKEFSHADAPAEVRAVAWAQTGKTVVAGCADGSVNPWKLPKEAGGAMTAGKVLKDSKSPVVALEPMPTDDSQVVVASEDGLFRKLNAEAGSAKPMAKNGAAIVAFAIRPDGKRLASAGSDNIVRLINADDGKLVAELKGDPATATRSAGADRALALAKSEVTYRKGRIDNAEKQSKASAERVQKAKDALPPADKAVADAQKAYDTAKSALDAVMNPKEEKKAAPDKEDKDAKNDKGSKQDKNSPGKDAAKDSKAASAKDDKKSDKDAAKAAAAAEEKKAALEKELAKADETLKKAQGTKAAIEDEIKLSTKSAEDSTSVVNDAKAAHAAAQDRLKASEKAAADAKKAIAESLKPVRSVAISADGALLATAGADGVVRTWSTEKGAVGDAFDADKGAVAAVAFAGGRLISCPAKAAPVILEASSAWKLDRTLGASESTSMFADRVTSLDFSPDGKLLATGGGVPSRSGEIRLFDPSTGDLKKGFDDVDSDTILCIRFSPDGTRLATASTDRFVRVIELKSGKVALNLEGHTGHALSVAWSHDGHTLASAGADNNVRFWDAETGDRGKVVAGFDKEVTSITFVGDEAQAVATSGEGKIRLIRENGGDVRSYSGATDFVYSVAVTPDGATIVAGGQDGVLRVWEAGSAQAVTSFGIPDRK